MPGKFSDEKPNQIIEEIVALKPKMYSMTSKILKCRKVKDDADHECKDSCKSGHSVIAKGITKAAQKSIRHDSYRTVLEICGTTTTTTRSIRSYNHTMYSISVNKRGLSAYDDKKYVLNDGINTLSYGHYLLRSAT